MTFNFTNKAYRSLVAVLLAVTLLACAAVSGLLVSGYKSGRFGDTNENNTAYLSLTEGFTSLAVHSKAAALDVAATVSKELGLSDAHKELQVDSVHTFDGVKYYRLQQYYEGLPVFGRTVVIGADESGNSVSLNANTVSVSDKVNTTPEAGIKAVAAAAEAAVRKCVPKGTVTVPELSAEDLCIYNFTNNGKDKLAYRVRCTTNQGSYTVFVDADNASVLDLYSNTYAESAECYDMEGNTLTASYNEKLSKYVLGNEDLNTYIFNLAGKNYYEGANGTYVVSDDRIFGNTEEEVKQEYQKATKLFDSLNRIRTYYRDAYGEAGDKYLIGMYNDSYDEGNNSFATDDIIWKNDLMPAGSIVGVISIGSKQDPTAIDLLAHEYMHRIEQNSVGLLYRGESGALMEAYSDIFGELVEAGLAGKQPNWVHNGIRDLKNPEVHGYPAVYNGKYYVTGSDTDNGAVHKNSTVISHAAYLMWNGIDGTASQKLDTQTLARLWLNALQKFNARETFSQCAQTVYETAQSMNLTDAQLECVAMAFQKAGLSVRGEDTLLSSSETTTEETTTSMADPSYNPNIRSDVTESYEWNAVGDHETSTTVSATSVSVAATTTVAEISEPTYTEDDNSVG